MKKTRYFLPALALSLATSLRSSRRSGASPRHHIVIDVSTPNAETWKRVLNNIENAQRQLGAEQTAITVVAYGAGLGMLLAEQAPDPARMERISQGPVVFSACRNTLESQNLAPDSLLPFARIVPSGVAELVLKQEAGWAYLKPGA